MKKLILLVFPILLLAACKTPGIEDEKTNSTKESITEPATNNNTTSNDEASKPKDGEITWETTIHW